jgi:hypothetical protein
MTREAQFPCWGEPIDRFFPREFERLRDARPRMREVAARLCAECPVRTGCAELGSIVRYGLWGGVLFWAKDSKELVMESMLPPVNTG